MKNQPNNNEGLPDILVASSSVILQRNVQAVRRHWWLLGLIMILGVGAGWQYLSIRRPLFVSKARLWVHGKMHVGELAQYIEDPQSHQFFFGTQIELMNSERLRDRAIKQVKASHPDLRSSLEATGHASLPQLHVNQSPKSSIFVLTATSEFPDICQPYLDALMQEFFAYKKEVRTTASTDAVTSISEQIAKLERDIQTDQERLNRFQETNNIVLLTEQERAGSVQITQLHTQRSLMKLELQLLKAAAVERSARPDLITNSLASAIDSNRALGITTAATSQPVDYVSTQEQVERLRLEREQWGRVLRPKHPKMVKLQEAIERGEKVIQFFRTQNLEQLAATKQAVQMRIEGVEKAIEELASSVNQANLTLAIVNGIKGQIQRHQSLSDRLLSLLQGVDMNSSINQENFAILEAAGPAKPADPRTVPILLAFLGAATLLGFGVIVWVDRYRDRCETLTELRGQFVEDVFGEIPQVKSNGGNGRLPLLEAADRRHIFAVSCRNLRSSLLYGSEEKPKVILVTSTSPNEGKSTVAANLARALALGGTRVLLIDGDLHNGQIHQQVNIPASPGLTDCIEQKGNLADFVSFSSFANLDVLPRGKRTYASGDLFLSARFDSLLRQARQAYDYVLIDSIPVFAADDAATLAPKSDGVLFVIRRNQTNSRLAREALELLYHRRAKVLGLVFNGVDTNGGSYPYYKFEKYYNETSNSETNGVHTAHA